MVGLLMLLSVVAWLFILIMLARKKGDHAMGMLFLIVFFFVAWSFILVMLDPKQRDHAGEYFLQLLLFLSLGGALIFIATMVDRRQLQELDKIWSQLARHTGLSFNPGSRSRLRDHNPPSVRGEYRGRYLSLTKVAELIPAGHGNDIAAVYTMISLPVDNPANLSLAVRPRGILARVFRKSDVAGGDEDFDRYFGVKGSPREFIHRAVELIVLQKAILVQRPRGTVMLTDSPFSWTTWSRPSIELKGSHLVSRQSGVLTDVKVQVTFLDLLCDLAELTEQMQSQVVTLAST